MRRSKAISPMIAIVLLIAFTVAIAGILTTWGTGLLGTTTGAVESGTEYKIKCLNVMLQLKSIKYYGDTRTGLVGYWKFDDGSGSTATDSSGNGNTGTLINSPPWVSGKYGNALVFDETTPLVINDDQGTANWTGATEVNVITTNTARGNESINITLGPYESSGNRGVLYSHPTNGVWDLSNKDFLSLYMKVPGTGSTVSLQLYDSANKQREYTAFIYNNVDSDSGWHRFIFPLYAYNSQASGFDLSKVNRTLFVIYTGTAAKIYYIDRIVADNFQHVNISSSAELNPTNEITISAWVYKEDDMGARTAAWGGWFRGDNIVYKEGQCLLDLYFNKPRFIIWNTTKNANSSTVAGNTISANTWHYLVGTYSSSTHEIKLYIDGVLNKTTTLPSGYSDYSIGTSVNATEIGKIWNGTIDEVRIYNRALSAGEIQDEYQYQSFIRGLLLHTGGAESVNNATITAAGGGYTNTTTAFTTSTFDPGSGYSFTINTTGGMGAAPDIISVTAKCGNIGVVGECNPGQGCMSSG